MINHPETILLVITKGDVGGAQIHCLDIIRLLKERYRFLLVCGEEGYLTAEARLLGIKVSVLESLQRPISPRMDWAAYKELKALMLETNPSIVHAHSSKAGVLARIAAARANIPAVFTAHGWAFTKGVSRKQWIVGLLSEWILRHFSAVVIAVSKYDYALAKRYRVCALSNLKVVQNGVGELASASSVTNVAPKIVNIGRLGGQKNHQFLVKCLAQLDQEFEAIIIGTGDEYHSLVSQIASLGLENKVQLIRNVDNVSSYLNQGDVFVLSSEYEGLPLSVLEAMSGKLAVVSTDVGGVSEAVVEGETGYLVARNDEQAMTARITELLQNTTLRKSMGEAGYQRYQQYFTAERMVSDIDEIYRQVLSAN
ncbi:MAG: glycosyltransferase involved in cell wall biosynthesis [Gammaproteobacteria bacterium]|jgi:glycosyltransferase involved in cell wall biosynthesis